MKKLLCLAAMLFVLPAAAHALEAAPENSAQAAILIHMDSGDVLYGKNESEKHLIASTTKLMTALVTAEHCALTEEVSVTRTHCAVEGSSVYLQPGERYTVEELLYGLLLSSGNDAAAALADHVGGSEAGFAKLMNARGEALGLQNSHFCNPHGLDAPEHYSCAADLAVIMSAVMDNDSLAAIIGTKSYDVGENTCINHNKLLWSYEGCKGGKTGYTMAAGRTLVTMAERDGLRLICVTLADPEDWKDHAALYDWGFANYCCRRLSPMGVLARIPVISGTKESVGIVAENVPGILLRRDCTTDIRLELPDFVYAGIESGDIAGSALVTVDGEFLCRIELLFAESVEVDENARLTAWEKFKRAWYIANRYGGMGYYGLVY